MVFLFAQCPLLLPLAAADEEGRNTRYWHRCTVVGRCIVVGKVTEGRSSCSED